MPLTITTAAGQAHHFVVEVARTPEEHGAVVVSRDLRVAVRNAIWLEANARAQLAAIQLGGQVKYISAEEARTMLGSRGDPERAWDYWKRRALGPK